MYSVDYLTESPTAGILSAVLKIKDRIIGDSMSNSLMTLKELEARKKQIDAEYKEARQKANETKEQRNKLNNAMTEARREVHGSRRAIKKCIREARTILTDGATQRMQELADEIMIHAPHFALNLRRFAESSEELQSL